MKKDIQKKCDIGASASPEPDVSSPPKKYIFHTQELKNGKSTVEKLIFGLSNDSPPITPQDAILLLAKSIQEQAWSECKEIMFAGDQNLLQSLLTEGHTLDGEQVSTCKASLDLAGMCQHVISLVEEFELSKTTGVINGKMADRIYRLVLACCYLGRQDILLEIRKNLPKDEADNLISRLQNTIGAGLNAILKKTQELSKKIDEHAAQSSAEHQEQDKELADHDASVTAAHAAQDKQLAGVPAMVEREQIDSARELQKILAQAELMGLPPEELKLVGLWFSVGRVSEIALKMGVSRQAVYKRMRAIGSRYKVKGLPDPFVRLPSRREAERQRQEDASDRQVEQIIDDAWRSDK